MNKKKSYSLIAIVSVLLISLLINQVTYVYTAAQDQEKYFVDKANLALESIVSKMSDDYEVCQSVGSCFTDGSTSSCKTAFATQKEWKRVDSIIKQELQAFQIDLKYNFDFCVDPLKQLQETKNRNTFTRTLHEALPKSGIIMSLEFPSKSNYILKQIGPIFISSILIILLISILFVITFQFYKKEKLKAERTRDFLNNMTHEFKTPLANIAFANNMLAKQSSGLSPEKIRRYTQIIRSENEKMVANSEDILEMAKQEFNHSNLLLEDVNIHDVIYDLRKNFMETNSEININLELKAQHFEVKGKTTFVQNVISNLIDNAIKYCKQTPQIYISIYQENKSLMILISDNGVGISKSDLELVFDKFYRVSSGNRHDVKGFGLGLSYVKMIVEQMNGSIEVKSQLGKGSVFSIKFPISHE